MSTSARTRLGHEADELLASYLRKIETTSEQLDDSEVWWRANPACNSVGNLLLHLTGNLSQWILAGLGDEPFERHRDTEFETQGGASRDELLAGLRGVVERARAVARDVDDARLSTPFRIQGYDRDGFGVLIHAVEHMAMHTGQIILIVKQLKGPEAGLEFYPHLRRL